MARNFQLPLDMKFHRRDHKRFPLLTTLTQMNLIFTLPPHLLESHVNLFFYLRLGFSGAVLPLRFPAETPCKQSDAHLMPLHMTVLYRAVCPTLYHCPCL